MTVRPWGLYLFFLAWAAALCAVVDRRGARDDRDAFVDRHAAVLRQAAVALQDALTVDEPLLPEAWVRRLAGEEEALYARLLDAEDRVVAAAGDVPAGLPASSADVAAGVRVLEWGEDRPALDFSQALWVRGARWGTLRWGLLPAGLDARRGERRKALAASWAWAAAVGGAAAWFARRRSA